eukprot:15471258-Alexandrium_andersonii.AAC.1
MRALKRQGLFLTTEEPRCTPALKAPRGEARLRSVHGPLRRNLGLGKRARATGPPRHILGGGVEPRGCRRSKSGGPRQPPAPMAPCLICCSNCATMGAEGQRPLMPRGHACSPAGDAEEPPRPRRPLRWPFLGTTRQELRLPMLRGGILERCCAVRLGSFLAPGGSPCANKARPSEHTDTVGHLHRRELQAVAPPTQLASPPLPRERWPASPQAWKTNNL